MKSKPPTVPPSDPSRSEQTLVLPGYLFFVETIEVPAELEASEITDFAELSLESIAPFPIDRLFWGYLYSENSSTLLIYAAHQDRVKNEGFADLNDYAWVIPDFATLSGAHFYDDTLVALEGNRSISLIYFEDGAEIPKSVWVDTANDPATAKSLQSLRSGIRDLPKTAPLLHLRPVAVNRNDSSILSFEHAASEDNGTRGYDGDWQMLKPTESELWRMDVRDSDFKAAEQNKRRISAITLKISGWSALFALLLILSEGLLIASQGWLDTQLTKIDNQQVAVSKVEEKQALVNKLEQVAQNEMRPIEMLEAANDIRLKLNLGIEYDEVVIQGENKITIEGKTSSVNAINRYTEGLKNSGRFELIGRPKTPTTRAGKTSFQISLAYVSDAALEEITKPDQEDFTKTVQPASEIKEED